MRMRMSYFASSMQVQHAGWCLVASSLSLQVDWMSERTGSNRLPPSQMAMPIMMFNTTNGTTLLLCPNTLSTFESPASLTRARSCCFPMRALLYHRRGALA